IEVQVVERGEFFAQCAHIRQFAAFRQFRDVRVYRRKGGASISGISGIEFEVFKVALVALEDLRYGVRIFPGEEGDLVGLKRRSGAGGFAVEVDALERIEVEIRKR